MNIAPTSELYFNDYKKYENKDQYEKDYEQYLKDFTKFSQEKEELKNSIKKVNDLSFDNIQYFKVSELKEMFPTKEEQNKAYYLKRVSDFSNDDDLNKILFNNAKDLDTSEDVSNMLVILNYEKNFTKDREFDFPSKLNLRPYYNEDDPLESEFNFEDKGKVREFLENIIYHLDKGQKTEVSNQFSLRFKEMKKEYTSNIDENEALLDQMTKYIKPQTLEEAQKQKDEEQIALAMEGHGLDATSDFHRFTFGLMQDGYSKQAAFERANVYSAMNLIPRDSDIKKFGIQEVIRDSGYLSRDPVLKQSLMESFDKMDTDELKKVGYDIAFSLSFSLNFGAIVDFGEDVSPEEMDRRIDQYWKERFGTTDKLLSAFNERLQYFVDEDARGLEYLEYVIDAYKMLIDTLKKDKGVE